MKPTPTLLTDFLGFRCPPRLYCNPSYMTQTITQAIRFRQCRIFSRLEPAMLVRTAMPIVSEEYWEYSDVLQSVLDFADETSSQSIARPYTFVELGCGYGHWAFSAFAALKQRLGTTAAQQSHKLLLVDIVDTLADAIAHLAQLNGATNVHFHHGFVGTETPGGAATAGHLSGKQQEFGDRMSSKFARVWGTEPGGAPNSTGSKTLSGISLQSLFRQYSLPCVVDVLDVDIQGNEYVLLTSDETLQFLSTRVKRIHIGTHFNPRDYLPAGSVAAGGLRGADVAVNALRAAFAKFNWTGVWYFAGARAPGAFRETAFGTVMFGDGVLSVLNRNPIVC